MKREIKFRAWHIREDEEDDLPTGMIDADSLYFPVQNKANLMTPQNADEFKGTKGEWFNNLGIIREKETLKKIATIALSRQISKLNTVTDGEEYEANAKLISAAPDLLKVLIAAKKLLLDLGDHENEGIQNHINAAIKKALS